MAESNDHRDEPELLDPKLEPNLHLKNVSLQRISKLMKHSAQELDDIIASNIAKLDISLSKIRTIPVRAKKPSIPNASSPGDGKSAKDNQFHASPDKIRTAPRAIKPSIPKVSSSSADKKIEVDPPTQDNSPPAEAKSLPATRTSKKIPSISSSGDGKPEEAQVPLLPSKPEKESTCLLKETPIEDPDPQPEVTATDSIQLQPIPLRPIVAASSGMGKKTSEMMASRINLQDILNNATSAFQTGRNVKEKNMHVISSALKKNPELTVLDFRTLNNWLEKPSSRRSQHRVIPRTIDELSKSKTKVNESGSKSGPPPCPVDFTPPNEFDWFSFDKMNSVLPLSIASEVFSIVNQSRCLAQLKELYINAVPLKTTQDDQDDDEEDADIDDDFDFDPAPISEALSSLNNLRKLVLRGMCTDDMLQAIGRNCSSLTNLDISGSSQVTDVGIQNLVFKDRNEHSPTLYMIPAWILKNMNKMNPLVNNLTFLDYSLTSVSSIGRNIFQLLPGCYLFKRLTSNGKEDDFGHHIFVKEPVLYKSQIPQKTTLLFDTELSKHVGTTGAKSFIKLVESHPWKRFFLTLYSYVHESEYDLLTNADLVGIRQDKQIWGIVTPNQNERRIQGIVQWNNGILETVYTIYPLNMNLLGGLHTVKGFRGIVHGFWSHQFSLLPDLTQLDIFTEPQTLLSFMQYCPKLKKLTIRIRGAALTDDHIITVIRTSMLRNVLEEFWIAPAPSGSTPATRGGEGSSHVSSLSPSLCPSFTSISERIDAEDRAIAKYELTAGHFTLEDDLVQLSMTCLKTLVNVCPKLKKVGDLATWSNVEEEELYTYSESLRLKRHKILITWANINLPDSSSRNKKKMTK